MSVQSSSLYPSNAEPVCGSQDLGQTQKSPRFSNGRSVVLATLKSGEFAQVHVVNKVDELRIFSCGKVDVLTSAEKRRVVLSRHNVTLPTFLEAEKFNDFLKCVHFELTQYINHIDYKLIVNGSICGGGNVPSSGKGVTIKDPKKTLTAHELELLNQRVKLSGSLEQAIVDMVYQNNATVAKVALLIEHGADVNSKAPNRDETLLGLASMSPNANFEVCKYLFEHNANADVTFHDIPLIYCIAIFAKLNSKVHVDLFRLLIKKGINLKVDYKAYVQVDSALKKIGIKGSKDASGDDVFPPGSLMNLLANTSLQQELAEALAKMSEGKEKMAAQPEPPKGVVDPGPGPKVKIKNPKKIYPKEVKELNSLIEMHGVNGALREMLKLPITIPHYTFALNTLIAHGAQIAAVLNAPLATDKSSTLFAQFLCERYSNLAAYFSTDDDRDLPIYLFEHGGDMNTTYKGIPLIYCVGIRSLIGGTTTVYRKLLFQMLGKGGNANISFKETVNVYDDTGIIHSVSTSGEDPKVYGVSKIVGGSLANLVFQKPFERADNRGQMLQDLIGVGAKLDSQQQEQASIWFKDEVQTNARFAQHKEEQRLEWEREAEIKRQEERQAEQLRAQKRKEDELYRLTMEAERLKGKITDLENEAMHKDMVEASFGDQ